MSDIKLIHGDCLEKLKDIPDKSINLVLIDPPYNIGKDKWDKWDTVEDYIDFMGKVFLEIQRLLKDNGSFYFFHNDFTQMAELQYWIKRNTNFVFRQMIVWDKFNIKEWSKIRGLVYKKDARTFPRLAEYCLFYTLKEKDNIFMKILQKAKQETKLSTIQIAEKGKFYKNVNHGGSVSNWLKGTNIPTKEQYEKMQTFLPLDRSYEELRQQYETERYTFNKQDCSSVIPYKAINQTEHTTPKPIYILELLIKASSNEGDIVLDCFMGSGSTGVACKHLNRNFIGIEIDEKYFNIAKNRIEVE